MYLFSKNHELINHIIRYCNDSKTIEYSSINNNSFLTIPKDEIFFIFLESNLDSIENSNNIDLFIEINKSEYYFSFCLPAIKSTTSILEDYNFNVSIKPSTRFDKYSHEIRIENSLSSPIDLKIKYTIY